MRYRKLMLSVLVSTAMSAGHGVYAAPLGNMNTSSFSQSGNVFSLSTQQGVALKVNFINDSVFRLQVSGDGSFTDEKVDAINDQCGNFNCSSSGFDRNALPDIVINEQASPVAFNVSDQGDYQLIKTPELSLRIYKYPLTFALYKADNTTKLWEEISPIDLGAPVSDFDQNTLRFKRGNVKTVQTLSSTTDEHFYGGGQQNGEFEFKGKIQEASYSGGWDEFDRPNPAPMYLSDKGYGVLRNTWRNGAHDFRAIDSAVSSYNENRLDAYYFVGDTLPELVDRYTTLTGKPHLLARWAYYLGDADCYENKVGSYPSGWPTEPGVTMDVVNQVATPYKNHNMPLGWILPNDGYGCGYSDLENVVNSLDGLGIKTGLWTQRQLDKIATEVQQGVRVYKLDVAWTGPGYLYSLAANRDAHKGLVDHSDTRGFVWTVMGWAGTQRYSVAWTGDQYTSWDYIRWHIPTFIGSGLSGQAYASSDVNGIFGSGSETYTRDVQFKAFTPVLIAMSGWNNQERKHAWWHDDGLNGKKYRDINRQYLMLKSSLMPYMYNYAYQADQTGSPIIRAMTWEFPDDPVLKDETYKHQYMYGESLLVAPVYTPMSQNNGWYEDLYLPEGDWVDFWDGTLTRSPSGGMVLGHYPIDIDRIPVLVKAGAIIPRYKGARSDALQDKSHLIMQLVPSGDSEFTLFEDDGESRAYKEQNAFAETRLAMSAPPLGTVGDIEVTVDPAVVHASYNGQVNQRSYELEVATRLAPLAVTLDGRSVQQVTSVQDFAAATEAWFFDSSLRQGVIRIKTGKQPVSSQTRFYINMDEGASYPETQPYPTPAYLTDFDKSKVKVVEAPPSQNGEEFANAIDGDTSTRYHSPWYPDDASEQAPQQFVLDLGEDYNVSGFTYLPRPDAGNGTITEYKIYLSETNGNWGDPVAEGNWAQNADLKIVNFTPEKARFLKFIAVSGVGNFVSAQEFDVIAEEITIPQKTVPVTLDVARVAGRVEQDQSVNQTAMSMNGLGFSAGLGTEAPSEISVGLDGKWTGFKADVGIDDSCKVAGNHVLAQIFADGVKVWEYDLEGPTVVKPDLEILGIRKLEFKAVNNDSQTAGDCVNWANIRVTGPESANFNEFDFTKSSFIVRPAEQSGYEIEKAFDGNVSSMYHSPWNPSSDAERAPQMFEMDMGDDFIVSAFTYQARLGAGNGAIGDYRLSLSIDGQNWRVISSGTFEKRDGIQQVVINDEAARFIRFEALTGSGNFVSAAEFDIIAKKQISSGQQVIPQSQLAFVEKPRYQPGEGIEKAFDGDPATMYHSPWFPSSDDERAPQSFSVYLGGQYDVTGFSYQARAGAGNGAVGDYTVSVSNDGLIWQQISSGTFARIDTVQFVQVPATSAKFLKVNALNGVGDFISIAEFNVYGNPAAAVSQPPSDFTKANAVFTETPAFQPGSGIEKAFDGDVSTMYHSPWYPQSDAEKAPQHFVVDLGERMSVSELHYQARVGAGNGAIGDYKVSLSLDGNSWTDAVSGTFQRHDSLQKVGFIPTDARYVRFDALSGAGDWVSAAEFDIYARR